MKRRKIVIIGVLLTLYFVFILTKYEADSGQEPIHDDKLRIVTSFYPMYLHVKELTKDVPVEVINLTSPEVGCLHDYKLTVADMKVLQTADLLVINGLGAENFIDKAYEQNKNLKIIEATKEEKEETEEKHSAHSKSEEREEEHQHTNEHVWVSIEGSMEQVHEIAQELMIQDASHEMLYKANETRYLNQLSRLKEEAKKEMAGFENYDIVTVHGAFAYFEKEFGFNNVATISGDSHKMPTAKEVEEVIHILQEKEIQAIFSEKQYENMGVVKTIAEETKSTIYVLDSFVTPKQNLKGTEPEYIERTRNNLNVLKEVYGR